MLTPQQQFEETYGQLGIARPVKFSEMPLGNKFFTRIIANEPTIPESFINGNVSAQFTWISGFLQSLGFNTGVNGWKLNYDGTVELNGNGILVSTNFQVAFTVLGVTFWASDGANPNGVLTGTLGDIMFGVSDGLIYVNQGGTVWTALALVSGTFNYVAKTATYPIGATDFTIDCTANTFTVTLPTAVGRQGKIYNIKNSGAGIITVACTGGQSIDGIATQTVFSGSSLMVQSTNAGWIII
jgi:hypothetical protein